LTFGRSGSQHSSTFGRTSKFRRLRDREQVAAVCYRLNGAGIEFLLVLTRSGRWTFPKGGLEPGMTHAQTAALEAFEEAGVHGRIEHFSFARYMRRKHAKMLAPEISVHAHLCEVSHLEPPQEANREPTWFSADKAKHCLREDRHPVVGESMARVVDRAVARIQRLQSSGMNSRADALRQVRFEAFETPGIRRRAADLAYSAALAMNVKAHLSKLLRLDSTSHADCGGETGTPPSPQIIEIDDVRAATRAKRRVTSSRS
jgi:8-oxo-dGTP pyrophosphatase MutT (NUDIX family)